MGAMEEKAVISLCDGVPQGGDLSPQKALTAVTFADLSASQPDLASFLAFREGLKAAGVLVLNDDPSFDSTLARAYEEPLNDSEKLKLLKIDLHALEKRLTLPILEEEIRAYALLELRAWASRDKKWGPLYEKAIAEAKGGSLLGVTHKAIIEAYFDDSWAQEPEVSFRTLVARFLVDESYDLTKKKILTLEEAVQTLGQEPFLSAAASKDLLRKWLASRATGGQYLFFDGIFYAAALGRNDPKALTMSDLTSLYDLYYLSNHLGEALVYAPTKEKWRDFLHSEEMI
jgi:hypothetical protein